MFLEPFGLQVEEPAHLSAQGVLEEDRLGTVRARLIPEVAPVVLDRLSLVMADLVL
jgi:hypothetical protein